MPDLQRDVFVSYSHVDRPWVESRLVRMLETHAFKVSVDYRDFVAGMPNDQCMTEAVRKSRRTIVVLSQAWCDSKDCHFEGRLVSLFDPKSLGRRLIPILRSQCTPPSHFPSLAYRNFEKDDINSETWGDSEWELLVRDLRWESYEEEVANELGWDLEMSGRIRRALSQDPSVVRNLGAFEALSKNQRDVLERLKYYKDLHDRLQKMEKDTFNPLVNAALHYPSRSSIREIRRYSSVLFGHVKYARELPIPPVLKEEGAPFWVDDLAETSDSLTLMRFAATDAMEENPAVPKDVLMEVIEDLKSLLSKELPELNAMIKTTALGLRLNDLAQALEQLRAAIVECGIPDEKVSKLRRGYSALCEFNRMLPELVQSHDRWQAVDEDFRVIDQQFSEMQNGRNEQNLRTIGKHWKKAERQLKILLGETPGRLQLCNQFDGFLKEKKLDGADDIFITLRSEATTRFESVDVKLQDFSGRLLVDTTTLVLLIETLSGS